MATGAVINPQVLLRAEEPINRAAFDVGLLDGEGRLGAVVVRSMNEAVARRDQPIPAVGVDRQFILTTCEVAERWKKPFTRKIGWCLSIGVTTGEPVGAGRG